MVAHSRLDLITRSIRRAGSLPPTLSIRSAHAYTYTYNMYVYVCMYIWRVQVYMRVGMKPRPIGLLLYSRIAAEHVLLYDVAGPACTRLFLLVGSLSSARSRVQYFRVDARAAWIISQSLAFSGLGIWDCALRAFFYLCVKEQL